MNERTKEILEKIKQPKILIILAFLGIFLIVISTFGSSDDKKETKDGSNAIFSAEEYKADLESQVGEIVEKITGSKKSSVMITLESSVRYSYAEANEGTASNKTESDAQTTSEEKKQSYITIKTSDGGEDALLVAEIMPEIRGVAIVCQGGDDEYIRQKIENAVMAALNITSKRVYITGGNTYEN